MASPAPEGQQLGQATVESRNGPSFPVLPGSCPVCAGETFNYRFVTSTYRIAACATCGLLAPRRPTEAAFEIQQARMRTPRQVSLAERQPWLALVRRLAPNDTMLETGLAGAAEGDLEANMCSGAIVAWDVLGCMARPDEFLRRAHAALANDGVLMLTLPAADGERARLQRRLWPPLSGGYNWHFDRLNLQTLLFKTGFDRVALWVAGERLPDARGVLKPVCIPGDVDLLVLARKCPRPARFKLSVIVPVYNERETFPELMTRLRALELPAIDKEIIVVESGSTDGTHDQVSQVQREGDVKVIWQDRPRGKGFAVREGLRAATGDFVIIQDADLEYDLNDYSILLEPLVRGREAFVIGSRHATNGWKMRTFNDARLLSSFFNIGHIFFTTLINVLFDQNLDDPFSMFKVFRRDCVFGLSFECDRFDFDYELLIKLIRKGYRPVEIPVNYQSRSFAEGKKVSVLRDPFTWIRALWKYRGQRLTTFLERPTLE
jgi:Glycosyl transferase family 2